MLHPGGHIAHFPHSQPAGALIDKIGAEQLEQVRSMAHRPDGVFSAARTAPVGPTHAVDTATGLVACGITTDGLDVLDQDWEEAFFVDKCPGCFAAVLTQSQT